MVNFFLILLFVVPRVLFWGFVWLMVISIFCPKLVWLVNTDKATPFDAAFGLFWLFGVPCFILSFLVGFFAPSQVHSVYYAPIGLFVLLFYVYNPVKKAIAK